KNAEELLESDVLAVNLLLKANCLKDENLACMNPTSFQEEVPLSPTSPEVEGYLELEVVDDNEDEMPSHSDEDILRMGLSEYLIFLQTKSSPLAPHIAYMCSFTSELSLVVLAQVNRSLLSGQLVEVFRVIEDLKNEELTVKQTPLIEIVDNSLRNSQDFMKWIPASSYPKIKKYCVLSSRLEAGVSSFMNCLRNTWKVACLDVTCPAALSVIVSLSTEAKEKLSKYFVSLELEECLKSMSLGSCSIISINKYLEEFPGLIHFIYIDRSTHQLTAPPLWTSEQEGVVQLPPDSTTSPSSLQAIRHLTAAKIWSMVDFARDHLAKGHCTVLWKDKTFSYSYFLWFEDQGGNPLKPVNLNKDILKTFPQTGLLCGDFYKVYATKAFPNNSPSSLRGFELYCVHIGLATSPCILEQTRRLAASIWEIAGPPSTNPIDLL
ncbi:Hermansky-Pudlak syndrome 1-like protein, partial [Armadillidium nasatum]